MTDLLSDDESYLTTTQVAKLFQVDSSAVRRWVIAKKLPAITTPGGHRRFRRSDVDALLESGQASA